MELVGRPLYFLMKRELKTEEREEIVRAVAAGDRVQAISIYLSATEGNLTEAQNFIRALAGRGNPSLGDARPGAT